MDRTIRIRQITLSQRRKALQAQQGQLGQLGQQGRAQAQPLQHELEGSKRGQPAHTPVPLAAAGQRAAGAAVAPPPPLPPPLPPSSPGAGAARDPFAAQPSGPVAVKARRPRRSTLSARAAAAAAGSLRGAGGSWGVRSRASLSPSSPHWMGSAGAGANTAADLAPLLFPEHVSRRAVMPAALPCPALACGALYCT